MKTNEKLLHATAHRTPVQLQETRRSPGLTLVDNRPTVIKQRKMQTAAANSARLGAAQLMAPATAPVQRAIKKQGGEGIYLMAPNSYRKADATSESLVKYRSILQDMIDHNEKNNQGKDYSLFHAMGVAKRRFKAAGRYVTGRVGTPIKTTDDMVAYLKGRGADTTTVEDKFTRIGPVVGAVLTHVEIMQEDFDMINVLGSADQVHRNMISTLTSAAPALIRTGSAFDEMAAIMVSKGKSLASSLKGAMFEKWALGNVLTTANNRISFDQQGKMTNSRTSDGYDKSTGTLWDMKHYFDHNVPADQAADYDRIVRKGYKSTKGGYQVSSVSYLFPTIEGAKQNEWLANQYGFSIYYIDTDKMMRYR